MKRHLYACLVAALGCCLSVAAVAQSRLHIRGTIDSVDGSVLHITSREGDALAVTLAPTTSVTAIVPSSINDIRKGTYIGTAAMPQPDGTLKALEVQVFPESMRGVGEGSHPFDLQPHSTMTNGTVGSVVGTSGRELTVEYHGQQAKVDVPAGVPIITYQPGDRAMLMAGAHVNFFADKGVDGKLTASRISVGKNGLVPPT
jgi:hypothetical protein